MKRTRSATVIAILALGLTLWPTASAYAGVTQFTTYLATERPATGTPIPPSGAEVVLLSNGASATTTVSGSGRVVVGATSRYCDGWPVLSVSLDGMVNGTIQPTSTTSYGAYMSATSLAGGNHEVKITFTNDLYDPGRCDRNSYLASVRMEFSSSGLTSVGSTAKPDTFNTGVPDGTDLKLHSGNLNITQDGTVIDALDVRGSIYVKANDVTIKRSVVRGGPVNNNYNGLIVAWWGYTNLVVQDSTLRADYPSYNLDGLSGSNFTATRLDISRVVDTVGIMAGNASITNSWLHDTVHFSPDPTHSDNQSHNDGVQVHGGKNIVISGNNIQGARNSALMVGQGTAVRNITVANNWLSDGACTVNVGQAGVGTPILGMVLSNNRFGTGEYGKSCPMRLPAASPITLTDNVWDSTGATVVPQIF